MAGGLPEFNRVTQISANPGIAVLFLVGSSVASLPSGANEKINIFSPTGTVSKVKNASLIFPNIVEAGSGTKRITVDLYDNSRAVGIGICFVEGTYNSGLAITYMVPISATSQSPVQEQTFQNQLKDQEFDSIVGLSINFTNNTPNATVQLRSYYIMVSRMKTS